MARRNRCGQLILVVAIVAGWTATSHGAVVIDTLSTWNNVSNVNSFGEGSTPTYGQTVTVPAENILHNFTFRLLHDSGNPTTVRFFVMEWAGTAAIGPVLFETGPVTLTLNQFYQDYTVNTGGLALTSGNDYGLFFTSFNDNDGDLDASAAAAHPSGQDPYSGGRFVFNNTAMSYAALTAPGGWNTVFLEDGDMAFRAVFSSVPEASSVVTFAIVGLFAAALTGRLRCAVMGLSRSSQW